MEESIKSLDNATVFSTLDASNGHWQVEIENKDQDRTAFTFHHGHCRFVRMPFGFKNAPGTFQRSMNAIIGNIKWNFVLVYHDDIVILSKTPKKHIEHVQKAPKLVQRIGVTLKLRKFVFFEDTSDYLGGVIRLRRLEVATRTTDKIQKLKQSHIFTSCAFYWGSATSSDALSLTSPASQLP